MVDHLNAAQARAAARRLESIRAEHVPFADTLTEEKWATQAGMLVMMRSREWPGTGWNSNGGAAGTLENAATATRTRLAGKRAIMAHYTEYIDQCIVNARQPYAAHLPTPPVPSDPLNQMMLLSTDMFGSTTRFNETYADTRNALLMTLLALRAYKLEHGSYPAALSALVPGYLKAVPMDPFALSGPLSYKLQGAKFLLYSVGPDSKDDGGVAIFDKTVPPPLPKATSDRRYYVLAESKGDIVAGVNVN